MSWPWESPAIEGTIVLIISMIARSKATDAIPSAWWTDLACDGPWSDVGTTAWPGPLRRSPCTCPRPPCPGTSSCRRCPVRHRARNSNNTPGGGIARTVASACCARHKPRRRLLPTRGGACSRDWSGDASRWLPCRRPVPNDRWSRPPCFCASPGTSPRFRRRRCPRRIPRGLEFSNSGHNIGASGAASPPCYAYRGRRSGRGGRNPRSICRGRDPTVRHPRVTWSPWDRRPPPDAPCIGWGKWIYGFECREGRKKSLRGYRSFRIRIVPGELCLSSAVQEDGSTTRLGKR